MHYLEKLRKESQIREEFEKSEKRRLQLITKINTLNSQYNGEFLDSLEKFIKDFENQSNENSI